MGLNNIIHVKSFSKYFAQIKRPMLVAISTDIIITHDSPILTANSPN